MEKRKEEKKRFNKNFWKYCGLALLLLFVIATSITINYKLKHLKELEDANENIPKEEIVKIL